MIRNGRVYTLYMEYYDSQLQQSHGILSFGNTDPHRCITSSESWNTVVVIPMLRMVSSVLRKRRFGGERSGLRTYVGFDGMVPYILCTQNRGTQFKNRSCRRMNYNLMGIKNTVAVVTLSLRYNISWNRRSHTINQLSLNLIVCYIRNRGRGFL